jgi:hypothetical protein
MIFPKLSAINHIAERANHVPCIREAEAAAWARAGKPLLSKHYWTLVLAGDLEFSAMLKMPGDWSE